MFQISVGPNANVFQQSYEALKKAVK